MTSQARRRDPAGDKTVKSLTMLPQGDFKSAATQVPPADFSGGLPTASVPWAAMCPKSTLGGGKLEAGPEGGFALPSDDIDSSTDTVATQQVLLPARTTSQFDYLASTIS